MFAYTDLDKDTLIRDYCSRGLVVLAPDSLGIPKQVHKQIFESEVSALRSRSRITASSIPEVLQVLNSPGVIEACNAILGENWAIVPFTHNTPFLSGSHDQHWHKDDNGPYNGRKHRHHHAVQAELLYYPQQVGMDMGPTATVPYSQYWTFNHEENHDNFAGADHLDFKYQLDGMERIPVNGPKSPYKQEDIVNQQTDHDVRMRQSVEDLKWPFNQPFEVGPLDAGSVVIYSHNLLHRGNHRRDHWEKWRDNPRFMWRFWLYRTTEPSGELSPGENGTDFGEDSMTNLDRSTADEDVAEVWNYHVNWMHSGSRAHATDADPNRSRDEINREIGELARRMRTKNDLNEPVRIGAAYRLSRLATNRQVAMALEIALRDDRESVRRAATYGIAAMGPVITPVSLHAANSEVRWIRKAAAFCLGESGELRLEVVDELKSLLLSDSSVYVRSVAASALGCFGRRAVVDSEGAQLIPHVAEALCRSLGQEENRLSMDQAQGRSIKLVRPTDDCDVCEGIGIDYSVARFRPVRSAVRENALWSLVIVCSHGPAVLGNALAPLIDCLTEVATQDENVFSAGFAMDALTRLEHMGRDSEQEQDSTNSSLINLDAILDSSPICTSESLLRGGMPIERLVGYLDSRGFET